jgi:penicillin-binding protein 2
MVDRILSLRRAVLIGCGLLVLGLCYLELLRGAAYRKLAERNRLRVIPEAAPRGLIVDRTGEVVATNQFSFQVAAVPQELPRGQGTAPSPVFTALGGLLGRPTIELTQAFSRNRSVPFLPATLMTRVPKALALRVEEERWKLPGVVIEAIATRHVPFGPSMAHLLGSVGPPTAEMFPALKPYGVRPFDLVGRSGLESELDAYLRGRSGGSLIEVDHRARQVRIVGYREPLAGQPVALTIDARLQALIMRDFAAQAGAAVVMTPDTGAVLAMVSAPSFEPDAFATQDNTRIHTFLQDPRAPLINRATMGNYAPGSTAKLITALTALEAGVMTPQTQIECPGYVTIGDRKFHCWKRDGHGPMTLREALRESCNVYFMQVGRRLGLARLRAGFAAVGFGKRTGWLLEERPGSLPGNRRFSEGEVAMLAIGQSEFLVSPLQAALMTAAFANGGWLMHPWVVQQVGSQHRGPAHGTALGWSRAHLEMVRQGMLAVVNDPQGTGIQAHSDEVLIAGKTGTAQTGLPGQTHGWFVGYCPARNPIAAMAIVAEFGGSGGGLPAAIAKDICEYLAAHQTMPPRT